MKQPPLIRLVDDDPTVCESLTFVLELAGLQVKSFACAADFLAFDDTQREGCLLLDVRMPEISGLELQRLMKARSIDLPVVFLSAHGDIEMAVKALQNGAVDFLVKPPEPEKLVSVLKKAANRHVQHRRLKKEHERLQKRWHDLTATQRQVAQLIAKGFNNKVIADLLAVTDETVKMHRAAVYAKLDTENAVEVSDFLRELDAFDEGVL